MIRLLASGQSNALGRDAGPHPPLSARLTVWDNANDTDTLDALGSAFRFPDASRPPFTRGVMSPLALAASILSDRLDDDVALVLVAKGATPVDKWIGAGGEQGPMYRRLRAVAERAGAGPYHALLWHQGEADDQLAAAYANKFLSFIGALRTEGVLANEAPILVGETASKWTGINPVLRTLPELDPAISFVGLADLPTSDGVHFLAATGPEIGRRYARAFVTATQRP